MKWSEAHDVHFLKEMTYFEPWLHKKGSSERGEAWANLATRLGKCDELKFQVTQRSLRDRYLLLERRYKKKVAEEENSSGISPEFTELDQLMEDIVTMFEEADQAEVEKKKKVEKEAAEIQEVRRVSLESFKAEKENTNNQRRRRGQVVLMPFLSLKKRFKWKENRKKVNLKKLKKQEIEQE